MKKNNIPGFVRLAPAVLTLILGLSSLATAANYDATYDLFCNDCIDWQDLSAFTDEWLNDCNLANNWCGGADFSEDGKVDFVDFGLLGQYWWSDFLDELDNLEWADVMSSANLQKWQQPAKLDDFIGVHPRYLLTAAEVTTLKSKIASAGVHQDIWLNVVKPKADWYLNEDPTENPYGGTSEDRMRPSGRAIPWLALAYLLADEPNKTTYKNKAISWMLTVCDSNDYPDDESDYPDWKGNNSLGGAAGLVGVSIGYDWLYDELSTSEKNTIRDRLIYQAGEMATNPVHKEKWLANHNHVEHNGLAAAGFVLYGESGAGDANDWIRQADLVFQTAFMVGSCDGSSTEGHPYWGYSMESLLCYTEAARDLMGKDYYDRNWVENATDFIIFCTIPDFNMIPGQPGYANCVMSYGDSYWDYRSHGPTHILCRLASEYDNGYAQWLADEMIDRGVGVTQEFDYRAWASLLWYDETITPTSLSGLPTFKHFDDIGLVVSRSGWDEDAVMVGFKCGPMHGHKVQPYYEKQHAEASGYHTIVNGHGQPDVGSFQIYAYGKWLATEPGYSKYTASRHKDTYGHCTILAGGLGQWGEGDTWFDRDAVVDHNASSSIIKAESCADYDYIIGDAENIYRSGSLSKFLRHFVYIKPDLVLIVDELEASPSSNYFQWRLRAKHPRPQFEQDVNIVKVDNDYYKIENYEDLSDVVVMDVHFVHPELANFSTSTETITEDKGNQSKFLVADFDSTSGGDLLATVLHPRRDEDPNSTIISSSFADSVLSLSIGIGTEIIDVNLDLANQQVYCYGPASNPSPSSLATGVSTTADLSWTAGTGATSHDVYFGTAYPPVFQTNLTDTTIFDPGIMNYGATYYWRINEKNASGTITGRVWAFITGEYPTAPEQATNPSPSHDANDVSINANLSWTIGTGATLRNVYFGTTNPPTFQGTQEGTIFEPGTMEYETTYYWRIDERNVNGTTTGEIWQFTTEQEPQPPARAGNPSPSDGATDVSTTADFSWTAGTGATSHDVYFGTTYPPAFQTNLTDTTIFDPGLMDYGTTYYWCIDEKNANGTTTGYVWEFTTETEPIAPEQATNPSPSHEATNVSINANLSWVAGYGATSHDVYFGTASPPGFRGNVTDTTFYPGIMMEYDTTYYWRIDEKNTYGTTTGNVWSFTTGRDFPDVSWDTIMSQAWHPPARLGDFIGVHPRYLLTQAEVNDLKIKINSAGTHRDIWLDVVKPKADSYLGTSPPWRYWDEDDMRNAGRAIPWMALAYLMTDDTDYLDSAKDWLTTVCGYPNWQNDTSLGAAEALVGVSIGYDWLYDELSILEKQYIRDKLILQAERMASDPAHKERWLANHNHVGHNGLAAAGFVLYGEVSEAVDWIEQADLVFQTTLLVGSDDGSSTEGHQYWGYSMESLLCYTEAARDLMGTDYYDRNWVKHATDFIIFSTIPDFDMIPGEPGYANCVMSFGDSYRDYRSHGPTHILCRLASEYNNGYAQWLADEMLERGVGLTDIDYRAWANLLWYDETVTPVSLSGLATFKNFDDIGWVTSRSSWDEDAVMVGFKCGPMHGHKVQPYYEKQYDEGWFDYHTIVDGHGHPDVGSFQIYAYGKWLATEPGYSKYTSSGKKYTYDHCTILANGLGQLGEGSTWFDKDDVIDANASSSIIKAESYADYDYIVGDAENIYRDPSLSKFYRHFIYIKPDFILIVDELEASPSPNYFQWRLRTTHERSQFVDDMNIVKVDNDYYIIENNNDSDVVVMDVHFIHPGLGGFSTGKEGDEFLVAGFNSTGSDLLATLLHPRRSWNNASEIVSSSFSGSVIDLTIGCGSQEINVQLDLAEQQVVCSERDAASNPSPSDGATDVSTAADLSWTAGSGATSHDVYFGTSESDVNDATDPYTLPGRGNQSGTTFDPGAMDYKTTYYWRIDEVAPAGTTIGDVWRFTTELPSSESDWLQQDKLTALDGDVNDEFGCSVSISDDYAIVGAYVDDDMTGSAYIFKRDGTSWTEQTKLTASEDSEAGDRFGYCVSISGDYAIVGAWGDDGYTGSAYIFKRDGVSWTEQDKLTASDGAYRDYFGWSVSISGDYAIVGARYDDIGTGSAYIFKRDGESWTEQTRLTASDSAYRGYFGWSVSISGDYAVVGAYADDDNGNSSGSAYIFKRDGTIWTEQDKLTASDGAAEDYFGMSVSISGDYAVVGAYGDDDNGDGSGSAYIFGREGTHWSQQDKLTASDGTDEDYFGVSVSVDGNYAVVGAYYGDGNEVDSGSAYIFKRDGTIWAEQGKLTASDSETEDYFGQSVSISGDYVLVGAQGDDDNGSGSGSAYLFVNTTPAGDF